MRSKEDMMRVLQQDFCYDNEGKLKTAETTRVMAEALIDIRDILARKDERERETDTRNTLRVSRVVAALDSMKKEEGPLEGEEMGDGYHYNSHCNCFRCMAHRGGPAIGS